MSGPPSSGPTTAGRADEILAIRFFYPKRGDRLETIPFYLKRLRSFLRANRGKACWLIGGKVERPAYLLFKREVAGAVKQLIKDKLSSGLTFEMEFVDPRPLIQKYIGEERYVLGYLDLEGARLGTPESLLEEDAPVDYVNGFWAFGREEFIRAEECEVRPVKRRDGKVVPMLFLKDVITTLYRGGKPVKEIRSAERFIWITGVDEDCLRGKWRELAKRLKESP
jgi:hypothetical protein